MDGQMREVIDADFFRNITEYEHGTGLFLQVMNELNIEPVMHEFVAETELQGNTYLQKLFIEEEICVIHYDDYLMREDREEYEEYFLEAYERINCFAFPNGHDIYKYADRDESLGEIRSIYMARKMGYQYFMSDDADAKLLAKSFFSTKRKIEVVSLFDIFVMCKKRNTRLQWKDINPTVKNAMQKRQDKVMQLKKLYNQ